jgi:hypothetical protein
MEWKMLGWDRTGGLFFAKLIIPSLVVVFHRFDVWKKLGIKLSTCGTNESAGAMVVRYVRVNVRAADQR